MHVDYAAAFIRSAATCINLHTWSRFVLAVRSMVVNFASCTFTCMSPGRWNLHGIVQLTSSCCTWVLHSLCVQQHLYIQCKLACSTQSVCSEARQNEGYTGSLQQAAHCTLTARQTGTECKLSLFTVWFWLSIELDQYMLYMYNTVSMHSTIHCCSTAWNALARESSLLKEALKMTIMYYKERVQACKWNETV